MLVQQWLCALHWHLVALLCHGSYLVEGIREYISLFLPRIDVGQFIMQTPEVFVHPYTSCLILLINTVMGFVESGVTLV